MGKQVRFYMLPEDERMFLEFVCQDPNAVLLAPRMPGPELRVIENAFASVEQRTQMTLMLLWNRVFPIKEQDVRENRLKEYKKEIDAWVETGEIDYSVDKLQAPVIEYIAPFFLGSSGKLTQGRLWAEMYRLEENTLVYKGEGFESWYDRIARWLRRNFKRVQGMDGYFGPHVLEWYRGGGEVTG